MFFLSIKGFSRGYMLLRALQGPILNAMNIVISPSRLLAAGGGKVADSYWILHCAGSMSLLPLLIDMRGMLRRAHCRHASSYQPSEVNLRR